MANSLISVAERNEQGVDNFHVLDVETLHEIVDNVYIEDEESDAFEVVVVTAEDDPKPYVIRGVFLNKNTKQLRIVV